MSWLTGPPCIPALIAFLAGAGAGRFLNRCADKFPRHESLRDQLSALRATSAEKALRRAQNVWHRVPIVGWLVPGNPLARARTGENVRRAAVELVNGLFCAALLWSQFPNGFIDSPPDPFAVEGLESLTPAAGSLSLQVVRFLLHLLLVEALLVASVIDLERMIIPDASTVPAAIVALIVAAFAGGTWLVPVWYEDAGLLALFDAGGAFDQGLQVPEFVQTHPHLHGFVFSVVGLLVGAGTVWAVRLIGHWALGREAMGFGDVILMGMMGSFIGWQPVLAAFFLAPVCAVFYVLIAAVTGASREFPYGPWLSLATILLLIGWREVWPHVGRFFLLGRVIPFLAITILILLAVLLRGMRLIRGDERWYPHGEPTWSSADQLLYLSQENAPPARRAWKGTQDGAWPGTASSRGSLGETRWRSAGAAARNWQVRRKS